MEKDLDKCKETINIRMQKDVDYDKMTKDERESLVGPERLGSIHKALKKIGVRENMIFTVFVLYVMFLSFLCHRILGRH